MREVVLRVPAEAVEDVLDRLLPLVPDGVRELPRGRMVELKMRGESVPAIDEVIRAAGDWPHTWSDGTVPDDWRARRLLDYRPDVIGGRLVVRPDWAPAPRRRMLDIVLGSTAAFGAGSHPTTRTCLELLLGCEPAGSLADLGCGTGVLSILAAKLGWRDVVAVDLQPASVEAASANAAANGVVIEARVADLAAVPAPTTDAVAANLPGAVHLRIAESLAAERPALALVSGFGPEQAPDVLAAYATRGLRPVNRLEPYGWVVALLKRD
jgi:ribosomal protein L11 methyltransferase